MASPRSCGRCRAWRRLSSGSRTCGTTRDTSGTSFDGWAGRSNARRAKRRVMRQYLAHQRSWLTVERLPGYAPELNPVEQIWGNLKTCELANLCPVDILALRGPLRAGFGRVRRRPSLAIAFLRHAGLAF